MRGTPTFYSMLVLHVQKSISHHDMLVDKVQTLQSRPLNVTKSVPAPHLDFHLQSKISPVARAYTSAHKNQAFSCIGERTHDIETSGDVAETSDRSTCPISVLYLAC
jgi:hypothetical protein